jgi:hypothetical protein
MRIGVPYTERVALGHTDFFEEGTDFGYKRRTGRTIPIEACLELDVWLTYRLLGDPFRHDSVSQK